MEMPFFTIFFLLFIFYTACTPGETRIKDVESSHNSEKTKPRRKLHSSIADPLKIKKAAPYQEIHTKMHGSNFERYKLWPELEHKSGPELVQYCNRYLRCLKMKDRLRESKFYSYLSIEMKQLRYYIKDVRMGYGNPVFYKTRPVLMLMCRAASSKIHRFIEAAGGYSTFYVMRTNTKGSLFTIVDACPTDALNEINFEPGIKKTPKKRYHANIEIIEKAASYQEIHVKMHGDNFDSYKTWPELEKKNKEELTVLCHKYIKCIGIKIETQAGKLCPSMNTKMLKYYIMKTKIQQGGTEAILYKRHHERRLVRVLRCQVGSHIYQFVKAVNEYNVFRIMATNSANKVFTIVDACQTDVLNAITDNFQ